MVLALGDAVLHVGGEGGVLGRTTLGEGAVLLGLDGPVAGGVTARLHQLGVGDPGRRGPREHGHHGSDSGQDGGGGHEGADHDGSADGEECDGDGEARAALAPASRRTRRL